MDAKEFFQFYSDRITNPRLQKSGVGEMEFGAKQVLVLDFSNPLEAVTFTSGASQVPELINEVLIQRDGHQVGIASRDVNPLTPERIKGLLGLDLSAPAEAKNTPNR